MKTKLTGVIAHTPRDADGKPSIRYRVCRHEYNERYYTVWEQVSGNPERELWMDWPGMYATPGRALDAINAHDPRFPSPAEPALPVEPKGVEYYVIGPRTAWDHVEIGPFPTIPEALQHVPVTVPKEQRLSIIQKRASKPGPDTDRIREQLDRQRDGTAFVCYYAYGDQSPDECHAHGKDHFEYDRSAQLDPRWSLEQATAYWRGFCGQDLTDTPETT